MRLTHVNLRCMSDDVCFATDEFEQTSALIPAGGAIGLTMVVGVLSSIQDLNSNSSVTLGSECDQPRFNSYMFLILNL